MNKPAVVIRKVGIGDIAVMTRYRIDYLAELQGDRDEAYRYQLAAELEYFFKSEMAAGRFFALMAEKEGKAVAFGAMIIKRVLGDFNKSSYLEGDILNMYTLPEERRKGISSMILESLLAEAKIMNISKVALHTSNDGESLYRKFGFNDPAYPVLERAI